MNVIISGGFDDLHSTQVRFLEEAHKLGNVNVLLWSDALGESFTGRRPKFSQNERMYMLESLRCIEQARLIDSLPDRDSLPGSILNELRPAAWVVDQNDDNSRKRQFCALTGLEYSVISQADLAGFHAWPDKEFEIAPVRKKVVVTGCYDWLHSGHLRFFEEAEALGDLYVVVGSDDNVRLLKGAGHPLFSQEERRYMVGAVRFVRAALISSGEGWMDAGPEIERLRPDIFAVNEDGDKAEKRQYCAEHGLEYVVLKRLPKPGLPPRESTFLRGF
jgi:cytidyltransferase-like protein